LPPASLSALLYPERELAEEIGSYTYDPLGFVLYAFPWGTGELVNEPGPRAWQAAALKKIGDKLAANRDANVWEAVQEAIASGHDIGKSTLVSWLVLWAMSTCEDCRGIVTANTEGQLRTKTWPEVAKWHRLSVNSHWFKLEATSLASAIKGREKNWRVDIVPWSEQNTEAFAGLHNKGKRIVIIFDESSAISDKIFQVTEGVLLDDETEIIWVVCGNPTRQTGRFRDCFGRLRHRWGNIHIDSRTVEGTNKDQINKLVEDEGEDSDIVRVRVRGEFPLQAAYQLISQQEVANARRRRIEFDHNQPIVAGLDLARSGECETVLAFRCGRDARGLPWCRWRERDSVVLAGYVAEAIESLRRKGLRVHTIFADGGGLGGPIIDILTHSGYPMREVLFGAKATNPGDFANKGSEIWGRMRDWLPGAAIPDDPNLEQQMVTRDYTLNPKTLQLALVPKDKMLAEGLPSPDDADALALTFTDHLVAVLSIASTHGQGQCVNDLND
jgi:hypothetical protein